jgi:hypothetical protein
MGGQPMMIFCRDLGEISPQKARAIVRKVLDENRGNVSKTARILGTSRATIGWARDGPGADLSRRPRRCPNRPPSDFERLIVSEGRRTEFRYRYLKKT